MKKMKELVYNKYTKKDEWMDAVEYEAYRAKVDAEDYAKLAEQIETEKKYKYVYGAEGEILAKVLA